MKPAFILILSGVLMNLYSYAQTVEIPENDSTSTITLDILQPPSSPGANLIGVSPSEIQKPIESKAFVVSLQNATNNFTSLPTSFAVDIAPAWFFGGRNIDYERFKKNQIGENLLQSFVVSTALKNDTTDNNTILNIRRTQLGLGFKISLFRGKINDDINKLLDSSSDLLSQIIRKSAVLSDTNRINSKIDSLQNQPDVNAELISKVVQLKDTISANKKIIREDSIKRRDLAMQGLQDSPESKRLLEESQTLETQNNSLIIVLYKLLDPTGTSTLNQLKEIAKEIKYTRYGWKLDLAGGWAIDFPGQVFDSANVNRFGVWLVGGYELKEEWSFLGLIRYYQNPEKVFADDAGIVKNKNVNTLDWGTRLIFNTKDSKASFSGEVLYRSVIGKQEEVNKIDPSWRFTINAGYEFLPGTRLTLAIGRDFDGLITKEGNFIGFLNFLTSFGGNKRTLVSNR